LAGYSCHEQSQQNNYRNGYSSKTIITEDGQVDSNTPRDRNSSFEPQRVKKNQTRFTSMDDKILYLYSKGMTTRDIVAIFKEMYDADVSATLISHITNAVIKQVIE
jgi:putative transposase